MISLRGHDRVRRVAEHLTKPTDSNCPIVTLEGVQRSGQK
jgi:hypothetical protein